MEEPQQPALIDRSKAREELLIDRVRLAYDHLRVGDGHAEDVLGRVDVPSLPDRPHLLQERQGRPLQIENLDDRPVRQRQRDRVVRRDRIADEAARLVEVRSERRGCKVVMAACVATSTTNELL